ncbi:splicing regulatory glutamine/lysine-rich protein 1 isoform X2 [Erpetoichthys calabaricus]|uniref:splicing regulatory glutamine/lysine-rich protein 1 isoform X2 n=1 Tax=Erpetoichthys calabaricus TaxID=27687 RepID=UPI00109FB7CA|nr:splicing regulatory glutamine/lysine-rich protein 1 isoform X2 [Erpetoichthys calabaricus]XP_028661320.1 splicing regulatory glutamine/lysine-rich protein 1 isoform X2 [Erpetoichthys calabaricus]XP_028661321.1 splicing regulatory glutamine/lysine-rich protein 1 isoform X2 [Erpetoichthys calabaricus]
MFFFSVSDVLCAISDAANMNGCLVLHIFPTLRNDRLGKASMLDIVWFMTNKCPVQVTHSSKCKIPEEAKALSLLAPATTVASLIPGAGLLPIPAPAPLASLGIPIGTLGALQAGLDPTLAALGGISSQPPLMGNVDPSKIDEIRRTIYVGNLNSQTTTAEQLLEYFKQVGDVKFVRMAGDETQPTRFAFVEFADQDSVPRALAFNGVMFGDRPLKINHSNNAIVKPPELTPQAAAKELEDVMKRVREAQSFISAAIEPETGKSSSSSSKKAGRSRSRSPSRSRRKKSHSRSRSTSRRRSRSRPQERQSSRSSHKKRSRSRERRRSRSHSRDKRKDSKSKSTQDILKDRDDRKRKEKKGKTPPKSYTSSRHSRSTSRGCRKRSRSHTKSPRRSRTPKRKVKSPSPKRNKKDKKKEKVRERSRERSTSKKTTKETEKVEKSGHTMKVDKEKSFDSEKDYTKSKSGDSIKVQQNGSYTNHEDGLSQKNEVSE